MPEGIWLELSDGNSVVPSYIHEKWGEREAKAALELGFEECQIAERGKMSSMLRSWDYEIPRPRDITKSTKHRLFPKSQFRDLGVIPLSRRGKKGKV